MPTFQTEQPISVKARLDVGVLRIAAGDRTDTVVEVRPTRTENRSDARAAEQTQIEFADGALLIRGPRQRGLFGRGGSIDVTVELPAGSSVDATAGMGEVRCEGALGECRLTTSAGDIHVDQTGPQRLRTGYGDVTVGRASGAVDVATGSGRVRVREVDGPAVIKNSNGDCWIGEITGDLRTSSANGSISVDRAAGSITAKTACGDVRLGEIARGTVVLMSAAGQLEVGIREGTAAWLDVSSAAGAVRNDLTVSDGPGKSLDTVKVRARTGHGDVLVRRA